MSNGDSFVGNVYVQTSNNGGHQPEFWAKRATDHIVYVSENAHPAIRDQALAFRSRVEAVILHYMREAIKSDRSTLQHRLNQSGETELGKVVKDL
jgi:hypothetical protein